MKAESLEELRERFGLTYHVTYLDRAAREGFVRGQRVLEIGGSLPEGLVIGHYEATSWTAVDYRSAYSSALAGGTTVAPQVEVLREHSSPAAEGAHAMFDGDAASLPSSFETAFDVVFSLATFEHIGDVPKALERIYAVLRPGGHLVAQIGPVWSGLRGHHVFPGHLAHLAPDYAQKTGDLFDRMIPWQHLIMGPPEMRAWLTHRYGAGYAEACVDWIYESPRINRLYFEDYRTLFEDAGFRGIESIRSSGAPLPPGWLETLLPLLAMRHPGRSFDIDCFWMVLQRPQH
jgi:SAM-dependent methyltransferase